MLYVSYIIQDILKLFNVDSKVTKKKKNFKIFVYFVKFASKFWELVECNRITMMFIITFFS